jgi:hypothetical protein
MGRHKPHRHGAIPNHGVRTEAVELVPGDRVNVRDNGETFSAIIMSKTVKSLFFEIDRDGSTLHIPASRIIGKVQ